MLDFKLEDAAIGQMMNDASYALLKRLELKNILKRFDSVAETTVNYQTVKVLDDFAAAVSWLEGIGETDQLGLYYFSEEILRVWLPAKQTMCLFIFRRKG